MNCSFARHVLSAGMTVCFVLVIGVPLQARDPGVQRERPNVIMFIMDDLNDWVTPLGYGQVKTPNLDRLAKSGVTFTNAHAPGVFCAPSRTAILTGMHASTTGCYENEVFHYDHPDLVPKEI